ncbi:hypothetical protein [Jatrophihabitans sp. DSM 44399]|uniref:Uncharacterized protein n=1 Tax=Jatrophihabitans lederbergiae TaxID=3075547 RepID=A0ABU2JHB4_9ACTN|nr:hypothetical protein [Jatrophihabitans sp. DSM 44399]MDT0263633.1 hypothetical protein [Jatrophihabitans sp. DSM 44399]
MSRRAEDAIRAGTPINVRRMVAVSTEPVGLPPVVGSHGVDVMTAMWIDPMSLGRGRKSSQSAWAVYWSSSTT